MTPLTLLQIIAPAVMSADGAQGINGPEKRSANCATLWSSYHIRPIVLYPKSGRAASTFLDAGNMLIDGYVKGIRDFATLKLIIKTIKDHHVDCVHVQGPPSADALAVFAAKWTGIRCIITRPSMISQWRRSRFKIWVYRLFDDQILKLADKVVAVSNDGYCLLEKSIGVSPKKIAKIYNGVDISRYEDINLQSINAFKIKQSLKDTDIIVSMVAQLTPDKGWIDFIDTMGMLRKQFPTIRGLIIGDGPLREELKAYILKKELSDSVTMVGFMEDIRPALWASQVFVFTSYREGLPVSIIEALASGLPIIAYLTGGIGEQVINGQTGFTVPVGDKAAMVQQISTILTQPSLSETLKGTSKNLAKKLFSQDAMIQNYCNIFKMSVENSK